VPSNSSQYFNDLRPQRHFARYGYADLRADLAGRPVRLMSRNGALKGVLHRLVSDKFDVF
jgi:hypothetical protein